MIKELSPETIEKESIDDENKNGSDFNENFDNSGEYSVPSWVFRIWKMKSNE